jgi:hypothetical protein
MLREDNSGFIIFPINQENIKRLDTGKTFIYLVAFDTQDLTKTPYELSNVHLTPKGLFISDDVNPRPKLKNDDIEEFISNQLKNNQYDEIYFPPNEIPISINLTTCICVGWSNYTFELKGNDPIFWHGTFRDLTHEGRKLFYSIKKLHNNKEIRILTFNNI